MARGYPVVGFDVARAGMGSASPMRDLLPWLLRLRLTDDTTNMTRRTRLGILTCKQVKQGQVATNATSVTRSLSKTDCVV